MTERDLMLMEIWTFRADPANMPDPTSVDLTGYKVAATDGEIGKVDEATYETGGSYVIVDTGPWIFGKRVVLPAGIVTRIDPEDTKVYVSRTKDEIKGAPEFDAEDYDEHRRELGAYYTGLEAPGERPGMGADRKVRQG